MTKRSIVVRYLRTLYARCQADEVTALGAQLTYYLILAFFPFLIFLVTAVNFAPLNKYDILGSITAMLPADSGKTVRDSVEQVFASKNSTLLSIGAVTTVWAASNGVEAIIKALNKAYDVRETRPFWKVKTISVLYTLALAVVIVVSFLSLVFGRLFAQYVYDRLPLQPDSFNVLWGVVQFVAPLVVMAVVYTLLYRYAPNRHLRCKEVLPGALFAALGWVALSLLFSLYVNHFAHYADTYGSLGGVIVLLVWLYYSSLVIIVGGEINATLASDRRRGRNRAGRGLVLVHPLGREENAR